MSADLNNPESQVESKLNTVNAGESKTRGGARLDTSNMLSLTSASYKLPRSIIGRKELSYAAKEEYDSALMDPKILAL